MPLDKQIELQRLPRVLQRTGYGRSSLYAALDSGTFPKPVRLGKRSIAWVSTEIDDFIAARIAAREQAKKAKRA